MLIQAFGNLVATLLHCRTDLPKTMFHLLCLIDPSIGYHPTEDHTIISGRYFRHQRFPGAPSIYYAVSLSNSVHFTPPTGTRHFIGSPKVGMSDTQQSSPQPLIEDYTIAFEGNALGYIVYGEC